MEKALVVVDEIFSAEEMAIALEEDLKDAAYQAGRQVLKLVELGLTPSKIVTMDSFENAIMIHAAISGSTNSLLHIPAIAHELGLGSCWIHRAKEEFETPEGRAILEGLGIDPDAYEGIGNCIVGHAAEPAPEAAPRKTDYAYHID